MGRNEWKVGVFICLPHIGMGAFWMCRQEEEVEEAAPSHRRQPFFLAEVEDKTTVS